MKRLAHGVEGLDAGVLHVVGAVDLVGHEGHLLVGGGLDGLDRLDGEHRVAVHVGVLEGDPHCRARCRRRSRPTLTIGTGQKSPSVVCIFSADGHRVGEVHEAGQRVEVARSQHHRVGGRLGTDKDGFQIRRFGFEGCTFGVIRHVQGVQGVGAMWFDHSAISLCIVHASAEARFTRCQSTLSSTARGPWPTCGKEYVRTSSRGGSGTASARSPGGLRRQCRRGPAVQR